MQNLPMSTFDEIFDAAQALPPVDRWNLMTRLWEATPVEEWPPLNNAEIAEIQRRSAEYDAGEVEDQSWERVRQRIQSRLTHE